MNQKELKNKNKMFYKGYNIIYDFAKFKTIGAFENAIKNVIITMDITADEQDWLEKRVNQENPNEKNKKVILCYSADYFFMEKSSF